VAIRVRRVIGSSHSGLQCPPAQHRRLVVTAAASAGKAAKASPDALSGLERKIDRRRLRAKGWETSLHTRGFWPPSQPVADRRTHRPAHTPALEPAAGSPGAARRATSHRPDPQSTRAAMRLVNRHVAVPDVLDDELVRAPLRIAVASAAAGVDPDHVTLVDAQARHDRVTLDAAARPQHLDEVR